MTDHAHDSTPKHDDRPDRSPTRLLNAAADGDADAAAQLLPLVYEELRRLADRRLHGHHDLHSLGATALVHEAYIKLIDGAQTRWNGEGHFLAVAATAMRQILVDRARSRAALRHGGDWRRLPLRDDLAASADGDDAALDVVALDEALVELAALDRRQASVVELRVFAGLTATQAATALGVSKTTVDNDWRVACAWLRARLAGNDPC